MTPGPNPYKTHVFNAPPGMEAEVGALEVTVGTDHAGKRVFASSWELEEHELDRLRCGEGLWLTLWTEGPVPACVRVGPEPASLPGSPVEVMFGTDQDGHACYASRWDLLPHERAALIAGERLWLSVWCDGLPPACVEVASLPYCATSAA